MQNKNKSLAALVLNILTIFKYNSHLLKIVTVKYLQKPVYLAPMKRLKNQVRRIPN